MRRLTVGWRAEQLNAVRLSVSTTFGKDQRVAQIDNASLPSERLAKPELQEGTVPI